MVYTKAKVYSSGQINLYIKANSKMVKYAAKANLYGQTVITMKVKFIMGKDMAKEYFIAKVRIMCMWECGNMGKRMVKGKYSIRINLCIKECSLMIRGMGMEK